MTTAYSRADKARAVEVYLAEGATAAALAVGCSRAVVYVWLAEMDTVVSKKGEEARLATMERQQLKRAAMVEAFHDQALALLAAIDPADPATARYAVPACALADKALMMVGLLRKSTDPARLSMAELESMIAELEGELNKVAPADKNADVDQALARMTAELERKIRGEIMREIDQGLAEAVHPERAAERAPIMQKVISSIPAPNGKTEEPPPKRRHRPEPGDVGPTW